MALSESRKALTKSELARRILADVAYKETIRRPPKEKTCTNLYKPASTGYFISRPRMKKGQGPGEKNAANAALNSPNFPQSVKLRRASFRLCLQGARRLTDGQTHLARTWEDSSRRELLEKRNDPPRERRLRRASLRASPPPSPVRTVCVGSNNANFQLTPHCLTGNLRNNRHAFARVGSNWFQVGSQLACVCIFEMILYLKLYHAVWHKVV